MKQAVRFPLELMRHRLGGWLEGSVARRVRADDDLSASLQDGGKKGAVDKVLLVELSTLLDHAIPCVDLVD